MEVGLGQLIREEKFAPVMTLRETFADRCLRRAVVVAVRGVKIVKAGIKERVDHRGKCRVVDRPVPHRKPHAAKTEIAVYFRKKPIVFHILYPLPLSSSADPRGLRILPSLFPAYEYSRKKSP